MEQTHWTTRLGWLVFALLCLSFAQPSLASNLDWKLNASLNYESGKYGTTTRSSSLYVPFTVKRSWGDWYTSMTVPYLSQTSNGQVRNIDGRPVKIGRGRGSTTSTTQSGLGDIVARGGYALMKDDPQPLDLTAVAKLKLPTADKNKGLGTGEFDAGLGLEFGKLVVPGWTVLADAYYTKIGDPPGTDLNNQVALDVGFSHLLQKNMTLTVLLEGSNALVSGEADSRDIRAILDYRLDEQFGAYAGGLVGLSDGSPDFGFSLGGSCRF